MEIRCTQADHLNQQIIGVCIDSDCQYQRPYCNFCLPHHGQHLNKLTSLELFDDWIRKRALIFQNVEQKAQECKLALDGLLNKFIHIYNINLAQFSKLGLSQIDNIIKGLGLIELWENQFQQSIEEIKYIVKEILQTQKYQTFTFELMNENSIKQQDVCFAIAINKDYSIVVAGCDKQIKVFELKESKLNQLQLLSEHQLHVQTLNFMKKSNHFVSGGNDKTIIIWQMNHNNQWTCQHKLDGHSSGICTLILNDNENLIVSGSYDSSIKFWNKQNGWLCQQTIKVHTNSVFQISLNETQDKLVSCSGDSQILVIEYSQKDQIWTVIQMIQVEQNGYRLSFVDDNQFAFQPSSKEQMHVYEINSSNQQFVKTKQITVKSDSNTCEDLFPQQYIQSKCLLVNKNGQNINLIRKKLNGEFETVQTIQFDHHYIFGQLSNGGEYLITWDFTSKEIQIRKCKEI
ncbi:unnamed protein product [Paramecium primaurelia]|uniref:WD domain, G-beta repeat protein n=1 Tax=Paramecium primaurelia TaxID=5886 RepID=A0A8S1NZE6_PARPR|nr:unnamed protein product [Paramecium primaurelia]